MPNSLQPLLSLQNQDTIIDQLVHKRAALPQRQLVADELNGAGALKARLDAAMAERDAVASQVNAVAADVDLIDQRITAINARLYGSSPVSPKDAQAMNEEVAHLAQRKTAQEDDELALMESLEVKQKAVLDLETEARDLGARLGVARSQLADAESEIDDQLKSERESRDQLAKEVDTAFMTIYEKLRPKLGGVAVAPLVGQQCGGCHLTLSAGELSAIHRAAEGELVYCEECGRILIRS